tara:strand:+ start:1140 stop:1343 length:204 start_codon:yes stop_codon:yes gene_type:complete
MKLNSVLKKFDAEIEKLYDIIDNIKDVVEATDDYELSETVNAFYDQITECVEDGDVNIQTIRDQINS